MSVFANKIGKAVAIAVLAAAAFLLPSFLAPTGAMAESKGYTFQGIEWGTGQAEAKKKLQEAGFRLVKETSGPRPEFLMNNAWAEIKPINRGKRVIATGTLHGEPVEVELVFGTADKLNHVIVSSVFWNGTLAHAKRMAGLSTKTAQELELKHGIATAKNTPFGFVDTAIWRKAADGSSLALYTRGTNGMMFYPRDKTQFRVVYSNEKYQTGTLVQTGPHTETTLLTAQTFDKAPAPSQKRADPSTTPMAAISAAPTPGITTPIPPGANTKREIDGTSIWDGNHFR
ncbi:MAG: hypothetical protein AB7G15_00710 [Alphaproteobacteria bacterium]